MGHFQIRCQGRPTCNGGNPKKNEGRNARLSFFLHIILRDSLITFCAPKPGLYSMHLYTKSDENLDCLRLAAERDGPLGLRLVCLHKNTSNILKSPHMECTPMPNTPRDKHCCSLNSVDLPCFSQGAPLRHTLTPRTPPWSNHRPPRETRRPSVPSTKSSSELLAKRTEVTCRAASVERRRWDPTTRSKWID